MNEMVWGKWYTVVNHPTIGVRREVKRLDSFTLRVDDINTEGNGWGDVLDQRLEFESGKALDEYVAKYYVLQQR